MLKTTVAMQLYCTKVGRKIDNKIVQKSFFLYPDMTNPPIPVEEFTLPISITQNRESTKWSWLNPGKQKMNTNLAI